jgi:TatD DNase family protein
MDMREFDKDRREVIQRAAEGGLTHIVTIGIDRKSSFKAVELAKEHSMLFAAVGYHPHNAGECQEEDLKALAGIASEPKVVAWGEIGLDYYRGYASASDQVRVFEDQLRIAKELGLPVIIHDRDAHDAVYKAVKKLGKGERLGVVHCFSGDVQLATALVDLGYYISIPGTVTYKNALQIKEVATKIPIDRMLIETDAPFLAPIPKRGKRNEPLFVTMTAKEIARLRETEVEEVARATSQNAITLFRLP